jgi:LL-diaminopimelate aminotransferase
LPERGFLPDLDAIPTAVAKSAILMWINYPNNPTGATADMGFLKQAVDTARRHGFLLCHDAPYCDVTYDGYIAPSLLQVPGASDVSVEFNSLSKTWNMAGWRVGMAVGNSDALASLAKIKGNMDSGIFRPLQEAAVRAIGLHPQWIKERNNVYQERIHIIVEGLEAIGLEASPPRATLYVWARIPNSGHEDKVLTSEEFALKLLNLTGVALAPGPFFGPAGEGYLRVSVTASTARIREATRRIHQFTNSL